MGTVDWKRFGEDLAAWEREAAERRFRSLCAALERAIRRALRSDELLDYAEVASALDAVAQQVVALRRGAEGRKPCERVAVELEPGLAQRLRQTAARNGLDLDELVALLVDRQLPVFDPRRPDARRRRRARRED